MLPRNVPFIFIPKTLAGDLLLDSGKSSEAADPDRLRPPGSRQVRDIRQLFNGQSTMEGYIALKKVFFSVSFSFVEENFFVNTLWKYMLNSMYPSMNSKYILMYISLEMC